MNKGDLITVKLMGGLGNQMFQYAFGKAFEHRTGRKVLFDANEFDVIQKTIVGQTGKNAAGIAVNKFYLNNFPNIDITFASKEDVKKCIAKKPLPLRLLPFIKKSNRRYEKCYCDYCENFFNVKGSAYFEGYFQSEKYLEGIEDKIRHDFEFLEFKRADGEISEADEHNLKLCKEIESCENSVCIHIRRGDYVNLGWQLDFEYYKRAIKFIKERLDNPVFFIFGCESADFIEDNFNDKASFRFAGEINSKNKEDWKDMKLMSLCHHAIIANSTFSWWAAYLNKNKDKIIIAPTPWLYGKDDIICRGWEKISV